MAQAQAKTRVDNERVRVTEWRFRPGESTGYHRHEMDYVVVPLTDGTLRMTGPDGERHDAELGRGEPYFREAGVEHDVHFEGPGEFAFIEVELKPQG